MRKRTAQAAAECGEGVSGSPEPVRNAPASSASPLVPTDGLSTTSETWPNSTYHEDVFRLAILGSIPSHRNSSPVGSLLVPRGPHSGHPGTPLLAAPACLRPLAGKSSTTRQGLAVAEASVRIANGTPWRLTNTV